MNEDEILLYEKIENYLKNRLAPAEHDAFEAEIASDMRLAETVELHRNLLAATAEKDIAELRRQMESLAGEVLASSGVAGEEITNRQEFSRQPGSALSNRGTGTGKTRRIWWLAAAAAVAGLLITYTYLFQPGGDSPQKLFADHFTPPSSLYSAVTRGGPADNSALLQRLQQAEIAYGKKEYPTALAQLNAAVQMVQNDPLRHSEISLDLAAIHLAMGHGAAAEQVLQQVGDDFVNERNWYRALALLQQGKTAEAHPLFETFAADSGGLPYYRNTARRILEKWPQ